MTQKPQILAAGTLAIAAGVLVWWLWGRAPQPSPNAAEVSTAAGPPEATRPASSGQSKRPGSSREAELDLDALRAENEARWDRALQCQVPGVPAQTEGVLQTPANTHPVWVRQDGLAYIVGPEGPGDGFGTLRLQGFEEVEVSWQQRDGRLWCSTSKPSPSSGPWGVFGRVLEADGGPAAAQVSGCGARANTEEDGTFYMTRSQSTACTLEISGDLSSLTEVLSELEQDVDLGELTLPAQMQGLGLMLPTAVLGFENGTPQDSYLVNASVVNSPAAAAGIHEGDRITHVDGQEVANTHPAELLGFKPQYTLRLASGREHTLETESLEEMLLRSGLSETEAEASARTRSGGWLY